MTQVSYVIAYEEETDPRNLTAFVQKHSDNVNEKLKDIETYGGAVRRVVTSPTITADRWMLFTEIEADI